MPAYHLSTLDLIVIGLYAVFIIILGLLLSGKHKNAQDYFLASRTMTWPFIGLSLFASNISSTTLIGLAGNAYAHNIAAYNYEWMAAWVLIVFVIFFLPFYLKAGIYTIPEFLEKRFDARCRYYFSILTLFLNIVVDTAGSLYAGGLVMKLIFPEIPLWESITLLAVLAGIYTIAGGLAAVIYTDAIQAVLLLIGAVIVTVMVFSQVGDWQQVIAQIPAEDLSLIRPLDDPNLPWLGLIGVFLLGFYFWNTNQFIAQRILSAKDVNHGRWGALFAGFLKLPVLFIMVLPGIMARALYPDLPQADLVYPTLLFDLLPVGILGLVVAGLIAALMSSIDSTLNSASTLVTMDFVHKKLGGDLEQQQYQNRLMWIGRLVTFLFMLLAVLWAPQIEKFQGLFNYLQQILAYAVSPVVAVFFLGTFWRRANADGAFSALIVGLIAGSSLYVANELYHWIDIHFLYVAPILFILAFAVGVFISLIKPQPEAHNIEHMVWSRVYYQAETQTLRQLPWYQNYRILSLLLFVLTVALLLAFW